MQPRGVRPLTPQQPRPPAGDLGSGGGGSIRGRGGEGSHHRPGVARGALLTCPPLPGLLTIYLAPSARPSWQPTCKTEPHRYYPGGGSGTPGFLLSPTSLFPSPAFSRSFCACSSGFHFIAQILCLQSPTCFSSPKPGLNRDSGGGGCRGTEFGGGWRWPLHSRCNMEAVGTEEILHSHLAN